jgi:hypothetical protein
MVERGELQAFAEQLKDRVPELFAQLVDAAGGPDQGPFKDLIGVAKQLREAVAAPRGQISAEAFLELHEELWSEVHAKKRSEPTAAIGALARLLALLDVFVESPSRSLTQDEVRWIAGDFGTMFPRNGNEPVLPREHRDVVRGYTVFMLAIHQTQCSSRAPSAIPGHVNRVFREEGYENYRTYLEALKQAEDWYANEAEACASNKTIIEFLVHRLGQVQASRKQRELEEVYRETEGEAKFRATQEVVRQVLPTLQKA